MIQAFGWCNDTITPLSPGRLCRGRERWIESLPDDSTLFFRTVISGSQFTDDSARDAKRGYRFAGVPLHAMLGRVFPGATILAFAEQGDPLLTPPNPLYYEEFERPVFAGQTQRWSARWLALPSAAELEQWAEGVVIEGEDAGLATIAADGFLVLRAGTTLDDATLERLMEGVYLLCGMGEQEDRPARRYNPSGLTDLLQAVQAVVLLHIDKHSPVVSIHALDPLDADETFHALAKEHNAFPVPFAIPPMLARWDRALYELRMRWDDATLGEFPIPPAEDEGGRWSNRRRKLEALQAALTAGEGAGPAGEVPSGDEGADDEADEGSDEGADDEADDEADEGSDEGADDEADEGSDDEGSDDEADEGEE